MSLDQIVALYENLTPETIKRFSDFYTEDAYFKDPFNEVRDIEKIKKIFRHMYSQVSHPVFKVTEHHELESDAFLIWTLQFRKSNSSILQSINGSTHLKFNPTGKIFYHRDYWDTSEELYSKLPILGPLMRWLTRRLSAESPSNKA